MSNLPSKPFSNGTEYEVFKYNFCEDCIKHKLREDGFPAFPEDGGCPIEDAMENARFDISQFPSEYIRELTDANDRSKKRSKTYLGVAKAMAEQWGNNDGLNVKE